jgi:hypothetical protein
MKYARPMLVLGLFCGIFAGCGASERHIQGPAMPPARAPASAFGGGPRAAVSAVGPTPARDDHAEIPARDDRAEIPRRPPAPPGLWTDAEATPRFAPDLSGPAPRIVPSAGRHGIPSPKPSAERRPPAGVEALVSTNPLPAPLSREELAQPLLDLGRYGSCHVPPNTHVRVDAVVFDGAALGVEVTSAPSNPPLERCIAGVVRQTRWKRQTVLGRATVNL